MKLTLLFEIDGEETTISFEDKIWSREWVEEKIQEVLDVFKGKVKEDW